MLVFSAVLCGANDWNEIEDFGWEQLEWLRTIGKFNNKIPSHDTLNRVFSAIDPDEFGSCFSQWISKARQATKHEVVAIDGKRICNSHWGTDTKTAIHMVSAFATENGLCLGQVSTHTKSNEITAIPTLLSLLELKDCIVTIDAMGCQTKIASKILNSGADYILAVKGNQPALEEGILDTLRFEKAIDVNEHLDFGHGRIETRKCSVYDNLKHIEHCGHWEQLKTIIKIDATRTIKATGKTTNETRYYISNIEAKAEMFNYWIRNHWRIENNLHWNLDVIFGEDYSRKRQGNAAQNFNTVLKIALSMLTKDLSWNASNKRKRNKAALNIKYREKLMNI